MFSFAHIHTLTSPVTGSKLVMALEPQVSVTALCGREGGEEVNDTCRYVCAQVNLSIYISPIVCSGSQDFIIIVTHVTLLAMEIDMNFPLLTLSDPTYT